MRRTTIRNTEDIQRVSVQEAIRKFLRHCKVRNLAEQTIRYYTEDCNYFAERVEAEYIDEVDYEMMEDFIFQELEQGKKVLSR